MTAPTPAQTQREHDADDLVTEEMVNAAGEAYDAYRARFTDRGRDAPPGWECIQAALRAVAPMIAARATEPAMYQIIAGPAVAAERERCAKIADGKRSEAELVFSSTHDPLSHGALMASEAIAAAIRARGEPTT
jgi:hypothetical protein